VIILFDPTKRYSPQVDISIPPKKLDPIQCCGGNDIEITSLWPLAKMREYEVRLETKIPKELSILPQANSDSISSVQAREEGKVYIQIGDTPSFATLEQIKNLNTKTVFVDRITDTKINQLSNDDIVMLKKE